jgi:signal transduction histidine kinase
MNPPAQFFLDNIDIVFFFYGLSFFCMGLAVLLESGRSAAEYGQALRPLGIFGIVHGSHEWFEMMLILHPMQTVSLCTNWISIVRVVLLAVSFIFLIGFGAGLLGGLGNKRLQYTSIILVAVVWLGGVGFVLLNESSQANCLVSVDVYTRYALAIPGSILTARGLFEQRKQFQVSGMKRFGNDVAIAALAFLLYGVIGQLFASPSAIFPSQFLNTNVFIHWFGFPVQVFRALMATLVAIFIIRSLRAREIENGHRLEMLREAQLNERIRAEEARAELLHRTVKAQESERQRIARELHDETGQRLTGLGMGLRALTETIQTEPQHAIQQAHQLEKLAADGIEELQRLVRGLHPPQLDDLGLLAALRWYAAEISQHSKINITVTGKGQDRDLPQDVRTVFFRIAQEAITNIIRHAKATQASIDLNCDGKSCYLRIEDDGCGFEVDKVLKDTTKPHWGLLGMQERASLIQGNLIIASDLGIGTLVIVEWQRSTTSE